MFGDIIGGHESNQHKYFEAANNGNVQELPKALLQCGEVDISQDDNGYGYTALILASDQGNKDLLAWYDWKGPDSCTVLGRTPYPVASSRWSSFQDYGDFWKRH